MFLGTFREAFRRAFPPIRRTQTEVVEEYAFRLGGDHYTDFLRAFYAAMQEARP